MAEAVSTSETSVYFYERLHGVISRKAVVCVQNQLLALTYSTASLTDLGLVWFLVTVVVFHYDRLALTSTVKVSPNQNQYNSCELKSGTTGDQLKRIFFSPRGSVSWTGFTGHQAVHVTWHTIQLSPKQPTEHRGRVVSTPASYSGGPGFKPQTGYLDWDFSWFFSVPPGKWRNSTLKIRPRPLPFPSFQFTINLSFFHLTLYSTSYWQNVFK
jgi:hypothetical protein